MYSNEIFSANAYNLVKRQVPIAQLLRDTVTVGEAIEEEEKERFMVNHQNDNMEDSNV